MDVYAHEKFSEAVSVLATSSKSIQDRVAAAFVSITMVEVGGPALPDDIAAKLEGYQAAWKKMEAGEEGQIVAWTRTLDDGEASEIASWFLDTEYRLR